MKLIWWIISLIVVIVMPTSALVWMFYQLGFNLAIMILMQVSAIVGAVMIWSYCLLKLIKI